MELLPPREDERILRESLRRFQDDFGVTRWIRQEVEALLGPSQHKVAGALEEDHWLIAAHRDSQLLEHIGVQSLEDDMHTDGGVLVAREVKQAVQDLLAGAPPSPGCPADPTWPWISAKDEQRILEEALMEKKVPGAEWFETQVATLFQRKGCFGQQKAMDSLENRLCEDAEVLFHFQDLEEEVRQGVRDSIEELRSGPQTAAGRVLAAGLLRDYSALLVSLEARTRA